MRLTHLDCSVSEDEDISGLLTALKPLGCFLCRANVLKRLNLAFGKFPYGCPKSARLLGSYDGHGLGNLADRRLCPCIEELRLEIATEASNYACEIPTLDL